MTIFKHIAFWCSLALCLLNIACKNYFENKGKELTEQALARVHDKYLYPSDVAGMGSGNSTEDSIKLVTQYINDWIQRNLIIDKAEKNLPKELLDIDKKVENYKQSLLIYNYESELISQKLTNNFPTEEKKKYYTENSNSFNLEEPIYNLQYIVLATNTPKIDNWVHLFNSNTQEDQVQLRSLCKISSSKYEIEQGKWYTASEIAKILDSPIDIIAKLGKNNTTSKLSFNNTIILIKKIAEKSSGEVAPFERVEKQINQILMIKNKAIILDQIYKDIYTEGLKKKEFEILTNTKK